jgi:hypothetical protein
MFLLTLLGKSSDAGIEGVGIKDLKSFNVTFLLYKDDLMLLPV